MKIHRSKLLCSPPPDFWQGRASDAGTHPGGDVFEGSKLGPLSKSDMKKRNIWGFQSISEAESGGIRSLNTSLFRFQSSSRAQLGGLWLWLWPIRLRVCVWAWVKKKSPQKVTKMSIPGLNSVLFVGMFTWDTRFHQRRLFRNQPVSSLIGRSFENCGTRTTYIAKYRLSSHLQALFVGSAWGTPGMPQPISWYHGRRGPWGSSDGHLMEPQNGWNQEEHHTPTQFPVSHTRLWILLPKKGSKVIGNSKEVNLKDDCPVLRVIFFAGVPVQNIQHSPIIDAKNSGLVRFFLLKLPHWISHCLSNHHICIWISPFFVWFFLLVCCIPNWSEKFFCRWYVSSKFGVPLDLHPVISSL